MAEAMPTADMTTSTGEGTEGASLPPPAGASDPPLRPRTETGGDDGGGDTLLTAHVPDAYHFEMPEGVTVDAALVAEATPVLQALGLSNAEANRLVPVAGRLMEQAGTQAIEALIEAGQQQRKAWADAARADKEIGGAQWNATLHSAAKALDAFGFVEGHPFRLALEETGFGNHPDMIRLFARLGGMVGEDGQFARGDGAARVNRPVEDLWYGARE